MLLHHFVGLVRGEGLDVPTFWECLRLGLRASKLVFLAAYSPSIYSFTGCTCEC